MKEYKVIKADKAELAEEIMNKMASEGWIVKDVTYWSNFLTEVWITFEREKEF